MAKAGRTAQELHARIKAAALPARRTMQSPALVDPDRPRMRPSGINGPQALAQTEVFLAFRQGLHQEHRIQIRALARGLTRSFTTHTHTQLHTRTLPRCESPTV